ncbi:hypothetical protein KQI52_07325 [bacterium]|nr:hypothetical protein [bacterium]
MVFAFSNNYTFAPDQRFLVFAYLLPAFYLIQAKNNTVQLLLMSVSAVMLAFYAVTLVAINNNIDNNYTEAIIFLTNIGFRAFSIEAGLAFIVELLRSFEKRTS